MSMLKNLFNFDKSKAKDKSEEAGVQSQPIEEQAQPFEEPIQLTSEQIQSFEEQAQVDEPFPAYVGYEPVSPNIDTNPDPNELVLDDGGSERYWDENGNPVYYGSETDADGYYDENGDYVYYNNEGENAEGYWDESGNFIYYGSEDDPHGYYNENGEYVYYSEESSGVVGEESAEGYWDENGNFIYYGSEDDPNGYYDENGEYVYYATEENPEGYWDENGNFVYNSDIAGESGYYNENGEYVYYADETAYANDTYQKATDMEPQKEKSYSVIADETIVTGNIQTAGHIDIVGEVLGNVDAGGNVAVLGSVSGNVSSEKMGLEDCRINGNLRASVGIVASSTSTIVGNVRTKNLLLDGKLKGNINVDNVVVLRKNAYFLGDIQAGQIAIEMGAIFNGNIKMLTQGDPDEPFYEAI